MKPRWTLWPNNQRCPIILEHRLVIDKWALSNFSFKQAHILTSSHCHQIRPNLILFAFADYALNLALSSSYSAVLVLIKIFSLEFIPFNSTRSPSFLTSPYSRSLSSNPFLPLFVPIFWVLGCLRLSSYHYSMNLSVSYVSCFLLMPSQLSQYNCLILIFWSSKIPLLRLPRSKINK